MKDIKCKCSHLKSEHHKSFFDHTFCNSCPCENYLKFDRPSKWDILSFIYGIAMIGVVLFFLGALFHGMDSLSDETLNEPFEITLGDFLNIVKIIAVLFSFIIFWILLDSHIIDYLDKKKRRTF